MLMPSTSLSLTARSTVLSVSLVASATDFCIVTLVEKAARGEEAARVRGIWRVAIRRVAAWNDMVNVCVGVLVLVSFWKLVAGRDCF